MLSVPAELHVSGRGQRGARTSRVGAQRHSITASERISRRGRTMRDVRVCGRERGNVKVVLRLERASFDQRPRSHALAQLRCRRCLLCRRLGFRRIS